MSRRRNSMMYAMDDLLLAKSTENKLNERHLTGSNDSTFYVGDPVWMNHPEQAWILAKLTRIVDDTHVLVRADIKRYDRGEKTAIIHTAEAEATLSKDDKTTGKRAHKNFQHYILPRDHRMQQKTGVKNMDDMVHLHEAAVLDNLRQRFKQDLIYTATGPILIAMNPFKRLPIYAQERMFATHTTLSGGGAAMCEPHVFTTVGQSYVAMQETGLNQSMVICGESGAGKTETTKLMLRYLSKTASRKDGGGEIEEQILESNPLMEAFGNAKTLRNDNSSRFGKYVRVQFNANQEIIGAQITNYLLEKSRIVHQPENERNYHIFYQLFKGCDEALRRRLGFDTTTMEAFHYLNQSGCVDVASIDDVHGEELSWSETEQAMRSMKIPPEEIDFVYSVLGGILHLGNIEYHDTHEECQVVPETSAAVAWAATLFHVDPTALETVLRQRVRVVGGQPIVSPLTAGEASQTRDALAKDIYNKLFTWLVHRINSTIAQTRSDTFIGILDIYGFEDLNPNGFEQLFINYANEKLQALFNEHIFQMEEQEYARENIVFDPQEFPDNQHCLDLIDKPPRGLLMLINEQCMRGDVGSDAALASKMHKTHGVTPGGKNKEGGHPHYEVAGPSTVWRGTGLNFVVRHYAGRIM